MNAAITITASFDHDAEDGQERQQRVDRRVPSGDADVLEIAGEGTMAVPLFGKQSDDRARLRRRHAGRARDEPTAATPRSRSRTRYRAESGSG